MAKISKVTAKAHQEACRILTKPKLSEDERLFVLDNWHQGAQHMNGLAGAFFTPFGLARDLSIGVSGRRVLDMCAGIGRLAFHCLPVFSSDVRQIVCVEINAEYAAVGRKVVPEAQWVVADIFSMPNLGRFSAVMGNPPFGSTVRSGNGPRYRGRPFEYHAIDIASDLAEYGVFIVPQGSAPFRMSGLKPPETFHMAQPHECREYEKFRAATGIELGSNCGIDTALSADEWREAAPAVEIVVADFGEAKARRAGPLFATESA